MLPDDLRPAHTAALDLATAHVDRITTGDLARPTPCAGWDLAALLAHMVGQHRGFAAAVRDGDAPAAAYAPEPWSPSSWAESVAELQAAFAAADLDATVVQVELAAGPLPVSVLLAAQHLDTVVHTWDIARSLGRDHTPRADVVAIVTEVTALVPDDDARTRPGSPFAPAVTGAPTTDAWEAALRHLGRQP